jgi:hypothetical protein
MEHIDHYVTKVTTNFKPVPFTFQPSAILQLRLPVGPYIRQRSRKVEIAPWNDVERDILHAYG